MKIKLIASMFVFLAVFAYLSNAQSGISSAAINNNKAKKISETKKISSTLNVGVTNMRTGKPVVGAKVVLDLPTYPTKFTPVTKYTKITGYESFTGLSIPGNYRVTVTADKYRRSVTFVTVPSGKSATLSHDVKLAPANTR